MATNTKSTKKISKKIAEKIDTRWPGWTWTAIVGGLALALMSGVLMSQPLGFAVLTALLLIVPWALSNAHQADWLFTAKQRKKLRKAVWSQQTMPQAPLIAGAVIIMAIVMWLLAQITWQISIRSILDALLGSVATLLVSIAFGAAAMIGLLGSVYYGSKARWAFVGLFAVVVLFTSQWSLTLANTQNQQEEYYQQQQQVEEEQQAELKELCASDEAEKYLDCQE